MNTNPADLEVVRKCNREYMRAWRLRNADRLREYQRAYYSRPEVKQRRRELDRKRREGITNGHETDEKG